MTQRSVTVYLLSLILPMAALAAQEAAQPACPLHAQHMAQEAHKLDQRGDQVMGFEHTRTTHHFLVEPDGGVIQVEANDPADAESLAQIRQHLAHVAESFARGDFSMPAKIHDRVLPGVPEMIRLKDAIRYRYEETGKGARVRITTESPEARAAVHEFLQAQIGDHQTGDPIR